MPKSGGKKQETWCFDMSQVATRAVMTRGQEVLMQSLLQADSIPLPRCLKVLDFAHICLKASLNTELAQ